MDSTSQSKISKRVSKRIQSCRDRYRKRVQIRKSLEILSRVCSFEDQLPHAKVYINNIEFEGLLDTGASISCMGRSAEQILRQMGVKKITSRTPLHTTDGSAQLVDGIIDVEVVYNGVCKPMRLYIVPTLAQPLYLGTDFQQAFGLVFVDASDRG